MTDNDHPNDLSSELRDHLKWLAAQSGDGLGTHYVLFYCGLCPEGPVRVNIVDGKSLTPEDMTNHVLTTHPDSTFAAELRGEWMCHTCQIPGPGHPLPLDEREAWVQSHIAIAH